MISLSEWQMILDTGKDYQHYKEFNKMSATDEEYTNQFPDEETPNPYLTIPGYIQSPPSAALGGANQGSRKWCSGAIAIAGSARWEQTFDTSFGEWVTVVWYPNNIIQGYVVEDGVLRGFMPCNVVQIRRNGTKVEYVNATATAQTIVVWLTDYESRPVFA